MADDHIFASLDPNNCLVWNGLFQSHTFEADSSLQNNMHTLHPVPLAVAPNEPAPMSEADLLFNLQFDDSAELIADNPTSDSIVRPESTKRKRRAPQALADLWDQHKARIIELYVDQNRPMNDVRRIMKDESGFDAAERQYFGKVKQWGIGKNIQSKDMQVIVRKVQLRKLIEPNKRPLRPKVRGKLVKDEKISRWKKKKIIPEDQLYLERPSTVTDPMIECRTISDRDPALSSVRPPDDVIMTLHPPGLESSFQAIPHHILFPEYDGTATMPCFLDNPDLSASEQTTMSLILNDAAAIDHEDLHGCISDPQIQGDHASFVESGETNSRAAQDLSESTEPLPQPSIADYSNENSISEAAIKQVFEQVKQKMERNPIDEFELACIYHVSHLEMSMSRVMEAGELLVSIISRARKLLGEDGWLVLWARADLATIYQKLGSFSIAKSMHFDTLRRSERVFGPTSWLSMVTIWNLSKTYRSQGSLKIAEKLNLRALDLSECLLGEEHISTLDVAYSLAMVYVQQGRLKDAEKLYVRVKEGYEEVFGEKHSMVLSVSWDIKKLREIMKMESRDVE